MRVLAFYGPRRTARVAAILGIEVMSAQLVRLEAKAKELEMMIGYVRAKIEWMTRGKQGRQPDFGSYAPSSMVPG
jgi:hypothetical protein